jgi:hypothetical protein
MRKGIMQLGLAGLLLVATAGAASAQDVTPVATTSAAPAPHRRLEVALTFLPMSLGTFKSVYGGMPVSLDAAIAPGGSLSVSYEVIRGLSIGLAPQLLFNVKPKEDPITTDPAASTELDAMVRIAYAYPLTDTIAVYAAALPGFSLIKPQKGDPASGFVIAGEAGAIIGLGDRWFVNLAGGYQHGFQKRTDTADILDDNGMKTGEKQTVTDVNTIYYRVALGVGVRF